MDVNARNPVKTTRTTLRIVEMLVAHDGASVTELAAATPFTKGTVHNHLATLRESGYVTKDGDSYHVGLRFLYPGRRATERTRLATVPRDALVELAEATGQRINLVAREEHQAVLVHSEQGEKYAGPDGVAGDTLPLHCSAAGKAVLANHDSLDASDAIDIADPVERTDHTITDTEPLSRELEHVRDEGLAYDRGELYAGVQGIAVPIVLSGTVRGAVGVLGIDEHMRGKTFQQDIPGLAISAAERLTQHLRDAEV
ncbi:IclR family transcriptional regulator (plasmid) [Haloplanus ruber]|uniref:IclR family transcriptional regulator n=1 Tax=Haloplanus ruber TaxID=869892 RepID=A0ABD6CUC7_9EURY|nr:IclR family transcriptional regulator [Haloplanus ruber]